MSNSNGSSSTDDITNNGIGPYRGRVILLGDGSEPVSDDSEDGSDVFMVDEDNDLDSQVSRGSPAVPTKVADKEALVGTDKTDMTAGKKEE